MLSPTSAEVVGATSPVLGAAVGEITPVAPAAAQIHEKVFARARVRARELASA